MAQSMPQDWNRDGLGPILVRPNPYLDITECGSIAPEVRLICWPRHVMQKVVEYNLLHISELRKQRLSFRLHAL